MSFQKMSWQETMCSWQKKHLMSIQLTLLQNLTLWTGISWTQLNSDQISFSPHASSEQHHLALVDPICLVAAGKHDHTEVRVSLVWSVVVRNWDLRGVPARTDSCHNDWRWRPANAKEMQIHASSTHSQYVAVAPHEQETYKHKHKCGVANQEQTTKIVKTNTVIMWIVDPDTRYQTFRSEMVGPLWSSINARPCMCLWLL